MGVCCSLILTRDLQPVQNEHQLVSYDGWNRLHKRLNWICGKGDGGNHAEYKFV